MKVTMQVDSVMEVVYDIFAFVGRGKECKHSDNMLQLYKQLDHTWGIVWFATLREGLGCTLENRRFAQDVIWIRGFWKEHKYAGLVFTGVKDVTGEVITI